MKNKTNTPTVVTLTLEACEVAFVAALQTFYTAKEKLRAAFDAAVPVICGTKRDKAAKVKLRETLIAWGEKAGIAKKTVANTVSGLMVAANLALRKRGSDGAKTTEAQREAVAELLEFCGEHFEDDDLITILRLALKEAQTEDETPAKEEKAA